MNTRLTKRNTVEELKAAIQQGLEAWRRAGEIVVQMVEDGQSIPEIATAAGVPVDVLAQLERIGRRQLLPELLVADYPAARALERLPLSEQERLMREPVEVMVMKDGGPDTILMDVRSMRPQLVRQVFARGHVRPLNEQRSWLQSMETHSAPVQAMEPYQITRKHTVVFRQGVEMTAKELLRIAAQLQD